MPRPPLFKKSLIAAAFALTALSGAAFARPQLVAASPAANASVAKPTRLTLGFSEALQADHSSITLTMTGMPGMADQPPMPIKGFTTAAAADGKGLVVTLPRALPTGSYDLQWTVMGNDHQPVSGTYSFKVR